jgi:hypothetical protein
MLPRLAAASQAIISQRQLPLEQEPLARQPINISIFTLPSRKGLLLRKIGVGCVAVNGKSLNIDSNQSTLQRVGLPFRDCSASLCTRISAAAPGATTSGIVCTGSLPGSGLAEP